MKIKNLFILLMATICFTSTYGQQEYWVFFTDKANVEFNPYTYFDAKAIDRRIKNNIDLHHISDFPVNDNYLSEVAHLVEQTEIVSRWFNAVSVFASDDQIKHVTLLPFVDRVELMYASEGRVANFEDTITTEVTDILLKEQLTSMGGDLFTKNEVTGKGVRVAVLDNGFKLVDQHAAFDHLRANNRIINTYDFIKKDDFVYDYGTHGRATLSCICGIYNGKKIGLASDVEVLLARTEYTKREPFAEEKFWLAAAEWADKNGADIISSSLGYTHHRYFTKDMDGKTSYVTRAANMAASKGILVVNSMGNEGAGNWEYMGAPADADSVLSIGAVNDKTYYHTSFSSFGPTSDKRLKPNVTAFGHVKAAGSKGLTKTQGTSFSCPLVSGFAACALQLNPDLKTMELFHKIEQSANLYPYFDYAHGYGIPQASFFLPTEKEAQETFRLDVREDEIVAVVLDTKINPEHNYLYYHIENNKGYLDKYAVIEVYQKEAFKFKKSDFSEGQILRVHYDGNTIEYKF